MSIELLNRVSDLERRVAELIEQVNGLHEHLLQLAKVPARETLSLPSKRKADAN